MLESKKRRKYHIFFFKRWIKNYKNKYRRKTKLINEIQTHIQTLNDKREAELLIAKYESDRVNLKEGEECFYVVQKNIHL